MIQFMDSCSWVTGGAIGGRGASLKYVPRTAPLPNANITGGRYGGGGYLFNVAAGGPVVYPRVLPGFVGQWIYDSRNLLIVNGYDAESVIWRYQNASGSNIFAYVTLDSAGHLRIYAGGDGITPSSGTLLYVSQTVLAVNTWYSVDMAWNFPSSGNGQMSLYIGTNPLVDNVLDTAVPGHPSVASVAWPVPGQPQAFAFVWTNNAGIKGLVVSDPVVNDNTGISNTGRLGPMRVGQYFPYSDAQPISAGPWMLGGPEAPATGAEALSELPGFSASGDAPDGDYSVVTAASPGNYLATMGRRVGASAVQGLDCYGLILGIALSACMKEPAAIAQQFLVVPNPSNGTSSNINMSPVSTAYAVVQGISEVRPDTGAGWTDGDASNAWWGLAYVGGSPVVTQLVLEKCTSTLAVPFNCGGGGSYSYQGALSL